MASKRLTRVIGILDDIINQNNKPSVADVGSNKTAELASDITDMLNFITRPDENGKLRVFSNFGEVKKKIDLLKVALGMKEVTK